MKRFFPSYLLLALATVLGAALLYGVETYVLRSTENSIASSQSIISERQAQIQKTATLTAAAQSLTESENEAMAHSLKKSSIVSYLSSIEKVGMPFQTKVSVVSVSEQKGVNPRALISILVTGPFDGVMRTMGVLENSSYDTTISNAMLTFSPTDASWSASTILSVALEREASSTPKKP